MPVGTVLVCIIVDPGYGPSIRYGFLGGEWFSYWFAPQMVWFPAVLFSRQ